ncbi:bifunctional hydroxymethylpyrimidine kinase/phosphomethylpyrimidine kinase [Thiomicrorhabdus sp.]|uniref:bifunctional hydroxymethylpyrimidine kinase/phosphomethylpyrimidine kinase n=1 Tax=Thiomicrorhabdus sp. TaxID=2039724 RepID=UPI002AA8C26D|nr:bifunctional hydroxymethylpyrimidine kinase/phosphomethylpyrimidine kinase [Thiomicrorhabdus sp.]
MTKPTIQTPLATVLTIAGSDTSAGAGIQADLKTIHAVGGYALTAITAVTAQNSQGVQQVYPVSTQQLTEQLDSLLSDYEIDTIKIGMLANAELINVVVSFLQKHRHIPVILDPILLSSSGKNLLDKDAINLLKEHLIPLITLITPNLPELNTLLKTDFKGQADDALEILQLLKKKDWPNTLLKGGHTAEALAIDYLFITQQNPQIQPQTEQQSEEVFAFPAQRIDTQNSHGTGCTLSSAIATQLAFKRSLPEAVKLAKSYLQNTLMTADYGQPNVKQIGTNELIRHGGLNHFGQKALTFYNDEEE